MQIVDLMEMAKLADDLSVAPISIDLKIMLGGIEVIGTAQEASSLTRHRYVAITTWSQLDTSHVLEDQIREVEHRLKGELERQKRPVIVWQNVAAAMKRKMDAERISYETLEHKIGVHRSALRALGNNYKPLDADAYVIVKKWIEGY